MAKFLNIPVESDVLTAVLEELPSDSNWDMSDPVQRAYLAKDEKRYDLGSLKRSYKNSKVTDFHQEKMLSSKEKKSKVKDVTEAAASSKPVKIENEKWLEVKQQLGVMKMGKG